MYVIKTKIEPTLYVKDVIPSDEGYIPTLTNDVSISMHFKTMEDVEALIQRLVEPNNFIGHRPPHRPK
jgi:hypothetical protein